MIQIDKLEQIRSYVEAMIKEEQAADEARQADGDRRWQEHLEEMARAPYMVLVRTLRTLQRLKQCEPELPAVELSLTDWLNTMPDLRRLIADMQKLAQSLPAGYNKTYYIIKAACNELIALHAAATVDKYPAT